VVLYVIHLFLSILILKNEALGLFERSVTVNRLHRQRHVSKKHWILRSTTLRTWNAANVIQLWGKEESS